MAVARRKKESLTGSHTSFYLFSSQPKLGNPVEPVHYVPTPRISICRGASAASTVASTSNSTAVSTEAAEEAGKKQAHEHLAGEESGREELLSDLVDVSQTETTSVLFPALKVKPGEKLTKVQAAQRRSKALRLVYRNLIVSGSRSTHGRHETDASFLHSFST